MVYQPKLSTDLIQVIYRIGRKENQPMTRVLDSFLRESIVRYIDEKGDEFLKDMEFHYVSEFRKLGKTNQ